MRAMSNLNEDSRPPPESSRKFRERENPLGLSRGSSASKKIRSGSLAEVPRARKSTRALSRKFREQENPLGHSRGSSASKKIRSDTLAEVPRARNNQFLTN